jgi:Ca2+-binding RTX toxin-like protein
VGSTLTFTAAPGEANHATINFTGEVMDTGAPLTPGAGCGVGGPGWVLCGGTLDTFNVDLGDGDDFVLLFAVLGHHATIYGGTGNDTIQDEADTATIQGGPGNDEITSFGGGDDTIRGGDGDDSLWGGGVEGRLDGQAGADTISGNADYSSRGNPVTATADGVADDGEAGENDNVLEARPSSVDRERTT